MVITQKNNLSTQKKCFKKRCISNEYVTHKILGHYIE
jgi:hypothetical protein